MGYQRAVNPSAPTHDIPPPRTRLGDSRFAPITLKCFGTSAPRRVNTVAFWQRLARDLDVNAGRLLTTQELKKSFEAEFGPTAWLTYARRDLRVPPCQRHVRQCASRLRVRRCVAHCVSGAGD
jgi:hypothetical protein